jgi:hypothetical protein
MVKKSQIVNTKIIKLISDSIMEICDDNDGWAYISYLGDHISRKSSFSPKNYGHKSLIKLLNTLKGSFETKQENNILYVRIKDYK